MLLLHPANVYRHSIFAGELNGHRKVIHFLEVVQSFIKIIFALSVGPENIPIMAICLYKTI